MRQAAHQRQLSGVVPQQQSSMFLTQTFQPHPLSASTSPLLSASTPLPPQSALTALSYNPSAETSDTQSWMESHEDYYPQDTQPYNAPDQHAEYYEQEAATAPTVILRVSLSPSQIVDLPIPTDSSADATAIADNFCQQHHIRNGNRREKLIQMIQTHLQHQQEQQQQQQTQQQQQQTQQQQEEEEAQSHLHQQHQMPSVYEEDQSQEHNQMSNPESLQPSQLQYNEEQLDENESTPYLGYPGYWEQDQPPQDEYLMPTFAPTRPSSAPRHSPSNTHYNHRHSAIRTHTLNNLLSQRSTRLLTQHRAAYFQQPFHTRLYAHAQHQSRQLYHQQQTAALYRQQLDEEEFLRHCTFHPELSRPAAALVRHSQPHKKYQRLVDYNGAKRERKLQALRNKIWNEEVKQLLPFRPKINTLSETLAPQARQRQHNEKTTTIVNDTNDGQSAGVNGDEEEEEEENEEERKAKIEAFLSRTQHFYLQQQQQQQKLQRKQVEEMKREHMFKPAITALAQKTESVVVKTVMGKNSATSRSHSRRGSSSGTGSSSSTSNNNNNHNNRTASEVTQMLCSNSMKKRQRQCNDWFYNGLSNEDGYIDRAHLIRLCKQSTFTHTTTRKVMDCTEEDRQVLHRIIQECDGEVRRVRKQQRVQGQLQEYEDLTWQLSLADFQMWFEFFWQLLLRQANEAEEANIQAIRSNVLLG